MIVFISGIMLFKLVFECVGSSVSLFVLDRFESSGAERLSLLIILYGIAQSLGSTLVPSLIRRGVPSNQIFALCLWLYGLAVAILIITEALLGGTPTVYSSMTPWAIFAFYIPMGICLGGIELVRRTLPPRVVGEDASKLKRMDASTHILYEVAGTSGAFMSTPLIAAFGSVYSLFLVPIAFFAAGFLYWRYLRLEPEKAPRSEKEAALQQQQQSNDVTVAVVPVQEEQIREESSSSGENNSTASPSSSTPTETRRRGSSVLDSVKADIGSYFRSVISGARIVFSSRQTGWLVLGYVLPLVLHRTLEGVLFPVYTKNVLQNGSLTGVLTGGSNFGELLGALLVLFFSDRIRSPLPWVRADAVALLLLWSLVFWGSAEQVWLSAGALSALMMFVSGAWAAGDVSLLAYLQTQLQREEYAAAAGGGDPLAAIMSFLFASYIITSTLVNYGFGRLLDYYKNQGDIRQGFFWTAGVTFTICAVAIFASTFLPRSTEQQPQEGQQQQQQRRRSQCSEIQEDEIIAVLPQDGGEVEAVVFHA